MIEIWFGVGDSEQLRIHIGSNGAYADTGNSVLTLGKIHHVVVTWNGSSAQIYVDGVATTTTASGSLINAVSTVAQIGANQTSNYYDGLIDDVSVFNTAFNSTQVQELFNDGVALDATTHSKSGNLLSYHRNDGVTTWQDRGGNFASFDGVNDVITRNAINVDYKSLSIWIRPSTTITTSSSIEMVMTMFDDSANSFLALGASTGSLTNELISLSNSTGGQTRTGWSPTGGETIPNGSWTHIGLSWDGSKYIIFYNGQPKSVSFGTSSGHVPLANNDAIRIGTGGTSTTNFFGGDIANVALWSESLTDAQMLSVYSSGHNGNIASIQSSDLELYYTFNPNALTDTDTNSTVQDRSGNDNDSTSVSGASIDRNGTPTGTPDSITIREGLNSGKDGLGFPLKNADSNVLRLNGSSEYVNLSNSLSSFVNESTATISAWIYTSSIVTYKPIFTLGDTNANTFIHFQITVDGDLSCGVRLSGTNKWVLETDSTIQTEAWTHVAVTQNGTSPVLYVNGDAVAQTFTVTTDKTIWANGLSGIDNAYVGVSSYNNSFATYWDSLVDEVKIYNRALSLSEIQKNYKHGKGKHKND